MQTRPRPLFVDLYCCSGGASVGYARAGFQVLGVDIDPQPDYPFPFVQADALEYLDEHGQNENVAAWGASPPCQSSSALTKGNRKRDGWEDAHVDLIPATRRGLEATGKPWVMENVQGSALRRDLVLCGLMFGLRVFRHRYFELGGWTMAKPEHPSHRGHRVAGWRHGINHPGDMVAVYGDGGGKGSVWDWQEAMGIDWTSSKHHLREAIPPAFTEFIGAALLEHLASARTLAA